MEDGFHDAATAKQDLSKGRVRKPCAARFEALAGRFGGAEGICRLPGWKQWIRISQGPSSA